MPDLRVKVRLTADLTQYDRRLVQGFEGITVGAYGMWSRGRDRFVGVQFQGIGTFDILWQSLEIIDQEFLVKQRSDEQERLKALKTAKNVVCRVGPRGGFKYLSYEYVQSGVTRHESTSIKEESVRLADFFRKQGIAIHQETE